MATKWIICDYKGYFGFQKSFSDLNRGILVMLKIRPLIGFLQYTIFRSNGFKRTWKLDPGDYAVDCYVKIHNFSSFETIALFDRKFWVRICLK